MTLTFVIAFPREENQIETYDWVFECHAKKRCDDCEPFLVCPDKGRKANDDEEDGNAEGEVDTEDENQEGDDARVADKLAMTCRTSPTDEQSEAFLRCASDGTSLSTSESQSTGIPQP